MILPAFGLNQKDCSISPFGNGLINKTWLVESENKKYILQRINSNIFKIPEDIAANIRMIADYLQELYPRYIFANPCPAIDGKDLVKTDDGYFRMFPFIENSHAVDVVVKPEQANSASADASFC